MVSNQGHWVHLCARVQSQKYCRSATAWATEGMCLEIYCKLSCVLECSCGDTEGVLLHGRVKGSFFLEIYCKLSCVLECSRGDTEGVLLHGGIKGSFCLEISCKLSCVLEHGHENTEGVLLHGRICRLSCVLERSRDTEGVRPHERIKGRGWIFTHRRETVLNKPCTLPSSKFVVNTERRDCESPCGNVTTLFEEFNQTILERLPFPCFVWLTLLRKKARIQTYAELVMRSRAPTHKN